MCRTFPQEQAWKLEHDEVVGDQQAGYDREVDRVVNGGVLPEPVEQRAALRHDRAHLFVAQALEAMGLLVRPCLRELLEVKDHGAPLLRSRLQESEAVPDG